MNKELARLLKLQEMAKKIPRGKYNHSKLNSSDGGPVCLLGWANRTKLFKGTRFHMFDYEEEAADLFGTTLNESTALFGTTLTEGRRPRATVMRRLNAFINKKRKELQGNARRKLQS